MEPRGAQRNRLSFTYIMKSFCIENIRTWNVKGALEMLSLKNLVLFFSHDMITFNVICDDSKHFG